MNNRSLGSSEWSEFRDSLLPSLESERIPFKGVFELTPLCNFKCNMCYIRLENEQVDALLTAAQWIDIGKQAANNGMFFLELTGGEVFSRTDFREIYEALYDLGLKIIIRTNGYLIDNQVICWLKKRKPFFVSITLYGATNEMYRNICRINNGFTRVTNAIDLLMQNGIKVLTSVTVTKDNEHDVECIRRWTDSRGILMNAYGGLINPFPDTERSIEGLKATVLNEDYLPDDCDNCVHVESNMLQVNKADPFGRCRNYGTKFCISWKGELTICNQMKSVSESILENKFIEAYVKMYAKLDRLRRPSDCIVCKFDFFCANCPAKMDNETGNPEEYSVQMCKTAKLNYKRYIYAKQKYKRKV